MENRYSSPLAAWTISKGSKHHRPMEWSTVDSDILDKVRDAVGKNTG